MERTRRRTMLRESSTAAAARLNKSAATPSTSCETCSVCSDLTNVHLNVIVHGLFGIVVWDTCIELVPPDVAPAHQYKAGGQGRNDLIDLDSGRGAIYWGEFGIEKPYSLQVDPNQYPVAQNQIIPDYTNARCRIILPIPNSIVPLRAISNQICSNTNFFTYGVPISNPDGLPLAFALTYPQVSHCPTLTPLPWTPIIKDDGVGNRWINLHIRAEPPDCMSGHSANTYKSLNKVFPHLNIDIDPKFIDMQVPVDSQLPLPTMETPDEYHLYEVNSGYTPIQPPTCPKAGAHLSMVSGRPANCASVVVNNAKL